MEHKDLSYQCSNFIEHCKVIASLLLDYTSSCISHDYQMLPPVLLLSETNYDSFLFFKGDY